MRMHSQVPSSSSRVPASPLARPAPPRPTPPPPPQLLEHLWAEGSQAKLGALQEAVARRLTPADREEMMTRFTRLFEAVTLVRPLTRRLSHVAFGWRS